MQLGGFSSSCQHRYPQLGRGHDLSGILASPSGVTDPSWAGGEVKTRGRWAWEKLEVLCRRTPVLELWQGDRGPEMTPV